MHAQTHMCIARVRGSLCTAPWCVDAGAYAAFVSERWWWRGQGHPTPDTYSTTTIRCHVNLKKSSLKLTRRGGPESTLYDLTFLVDADLACRVSVYVAATEHHDSNKNV
jgi:hypothetical protein